MAIEIDHMSLDVTDYEKAKAFYAGALAPLRGAVVMEFPVDGRSTAGLGSDGKPLVWIKTVSGPVQHVHLAFRAENREQVDAFYAAALAAGGIDNGPPGLRPHYHQHYYAAFVLDPDGHNIEAVSHGDPNAAPAKPVRARRTAKAAAKPVRAAKVTRGAKKPAKRSAAKPARKVAKPTRKAATKPAAKKPAARTAARRKPAGSKRAR